MIRTPSCYSSNNVTWYIIWIVFKIVVNMPLLGLLIFSHFISGKKILACRKRSMEDEIWISDWYVLQNLYKITNKSEYLVFKIVVNLLLISLLIFSHFIPMKKILACSKRLMEDEIWISDQYFHPKFRKITNKSGICRNYTRFLLKMIFVLIFPIVFMEKILPPKYISILLKNRNFSENFWKYLQCIYGNIKFLKICDHDGELQFEAANDHIWREGAVQLSSMYLWQY